MAAPAESRKGKVLSAGEGKSLWMLGDLLTIKLTGQETGGEYAVVEITSPPQGGPPPHMHHREDESFYVLEGEFEFLMGNATVKAAAGSFVYGPKGVWHTFKNVGTKPGRFLATITPAGFEDFFEELGEPAPEKVLPPPGPPDMDKLMALARKYELDLRLPG